MGLILRLFSEMDGDYNRARFYSARKEGLRGYNFSISRYTKGLPVYRFRFMFPLMLFLIAPAVHATLDGEQIYRDNCMVCHGVDGQGGVGVPLALPSFINSVDDAYLRNTIRNGRPGRVMPSFQYMGDAQVDAVIRYIRGWGDKAPPVFSGKHVKGDSKHGAELFRQHCSTCHGEHGEGGEGTGVTFSRPRDLPITAPAINNPGFLASASDEMIRNTLRNGREGTPMPSFLKAGLSEQQIDDIVAYIRSLEGTASPGTILEAESATLMVESPYTLEETISNIKDVLVGKNFTLIRVQSLDNGYVPKSEEDPNAVILYFCNFNFLNKALVIDPRVGMFLPCRVTVVEQDGIVRVLAINPMRLSKIFNNAELNEACHEMRDVYASILEEATL
jgi:cytochrome c oxidase cbb3-type subunit III